MRYIQLALEARDVEIHPLFPVMSGADFISLAQMLDWNVPAGESLSTVLFYVSGEVDELREVLDELDIVHQYDVTEISPGEFYIYIHAETTQVEREIWRAVTIEGLLLVPPLRYENNRVRFNIIGTHEDLQAAIEALPDGVYAEVERIGEYDHGAETIASVLTDRQYEAVMAGIETGYYEVPRQATKHDVAERLGCGPSTASEHLRKAESRIISKFLGGE